MSGGFCHDHLIDADTEAQSRDVLPEVASCDAEIQSRDVKPDWPRGGSAYGNARQGDLGSALSSGTEGTSELQLSGSNPGPTPCKLCDLEPGAWPLCASASPSPN